ncbi:MAG: DUF4153 domain-containing protein [Chitinispirillales bacterium]|jgi:hypothetical protein|nr:DUF4153 domain-containing protein [Chitinispirillales bacterium]
MKNIFSSEAIKEKFKLLTERFPISALLAAIFAFIFPFVVDHNSDTAVRWLIFLSYGTVICAALTLWLEDSVWGVQKRYLIIAGALLLWGAYCFFLLSGNFGDKKLYGAGQIAELTAIGAAALLALFFIPFLKKGNERAFWGFTIRTGFQFALTCCFGAVICMGLAIAIYAISTLFGGGTRLFLHKLLFSISILFGALYFLANIPDKTAKRDENVAMNRPLSVIALYILAPLALIYGVIMYAYLLKIIFTWELPNGMVSWLVSAIACLGLLITILLYPARMDEKNEANKTIVFITRFWGVIILPLLLLMSAGIFRRISDYGITAARLYLLLVNLWFYGIYAYIVITEAKRIKWIAISFAALALVSSVGFWSVPNFTKRILVAEVKEFLDGQKLVYTVKESKKNVVTGFPKNTDSSDREKIRGKMKYLFETYGKESIEPFINISDSTLSSWKIFMKSAWENEEQEKNDADFGKAIDGVLSGAGTSNAENKVNPEPDKMAGKKFSLGGINLNKIHNLNQYNAFIPIRYLDDSARDWDRAGRDNVDVKYSIKDNHLVITVTPDNRTFRVPLLKRAREMAGKQNNLSESVIVDNGATVIIIYFSGQYHEKADSVSVSAFQGHLFYNR